MEKIIVELDVNSRDAEKSVDDVSNSLKDLNKQATSTTKKTEKGLEDTGKAAKKSEKSVGGLSKGVKAMGGALKAAGIGIFLSVITVLFEVMRKNQKVLDAIETATNFIAVGFKAVTDALVSAYKSVSQATDGFDALKKVVMGVLTIALTPLKLMFYELKLAAQGLKFAYESIFGNDESIKQAKIDLEQTRIDILNVAKDAVKAGVDIASNIVEAVSEVGAGVSAVVAEVSKIDPKKLLETAEAMTVLKNNAEVAAAVQSGLVEKYDRLAEKQRQVRDEERNSISDRKKANDELLIILEKQEKAMLKAADAQIADAKAQLQANNNQENKIKLIEAENNKLGVLAQITGLRSEQKANDLALDREQIALTNLKNESESRLSTERQRFNAELIEDELLRLERLREIDELEAEQESLRLEAILLNANAGTQAKIDAQIALDEFTEKSRQTGIKRDSEISKAELALIEKKRKAKLRAFDDLVKIGGAETKFGKAMLIAKQLMLAKELIMEIKSTIMKAKQAAIAAQIKAAGAGVDITTGAAKSASALPFPFNVPLIIGFAAQAVGIISSIKGAMSAQKSATSGIGISTPSVNLSAPRSSVSSSLPSQPTIASTPPSFNTVGASGTNQLASAIGGQSQQPIQAFVVSSEVTTAQELDNNIVQSASL